MNELMDLPGEVWKDIEGYEGLYQVSNMGRVKSLPRKKHMPRNGIGCYYTTKERILRHGKATRYLHVGLEKDGENKVFSIHRLVAKAFIPNPHNKPFVNHIDGNKHNNITINLEWCTQKENIGHAFLNGLSDYSSKRKKVNQYDLNGDFICSFSGCIGVEKTLGFSHGMISMCCRGKCKTAFGYIWKYAD